ncbi:MAG: ArsR/SmtB family transcription factor [Shimia sp.]
MDEEERTNEQLAFRALADPSRRDMVRLLAAREMSIAELCESFEMTRTAVRKHVRVLEEGGIVVLDPQGRERRILLRQEGLVAVGRWLDGVPERPDPGASMGGSRVARPDPEMRPRLVAGLAV